MFSFFVREILEIQFLDGNDHPFSDIECAMESSLMGFPVRHFAADDTYLLFFTYRLF